MPALKIVQRTFSLAILSLLLATIVAATSENMHAQMLKVGSYFWEDYFILRGERPDANCDPQMDIDTRLNELRGEHEKDNSELDIFATEFDREGARESLVNQLAVCKKKHGVVKAYDDNLSDWVIAFRKFEHIFIDISLFSILHQKTTLILLLTLSAVVATWHRCHIVFRSIKTKLDHYVSNTGQLVANASLGYSTYAFYLGSYASGTEVNDPEIMIILMMGCALLSLINLYELLNPGEELEPGGGAVNALLTIPIHTFMLMAAVYHFYISEVHFPGIAIYFTQVFQLTNLHLAIGLYILVGMLLKETLIGAKLFDVFKPWNMPPEILAFVAILLLAYPTAYTGASGIMIIAMGAVVYQEMRRIGTRRQLALAVTAMTGSGVVLRPCLLVVGIAILNEEVVTDELFHWGFKVFLLGMIVYVIFALITRKDPMKIAPVKEALGPSLSLAKHLIPYVLVFTAVLTSYAYILDAPLDEFSAPTILPVVIMFVLIFERRYSHDFEERNKIAKVSPTVSSTFITAVDNSAIQIGALLMMMACSFTVGGIIEQGGGGFVLPKTFDNIYYAMASIMLFLIFIGMIMDPFGALILVTGTIAPIAYAQGINPIHFWMTCLMAFELGYLSPPVSLNHLLTRQVVGDEEVRLAKVVGGPFYYRHERIILPLLVMGTTLIIVAFGPLMVMDGWFG